MLAIDPRIAARQRVCSALRDPNARQTFGTYGRWLDPAAPVCVWGMVFRVFELSTLNRDRDLMIVDCATKLGITYDQAIDLLHLNDRGDPFPVLAEQLEALPLAKETDHVAHNGEHAPEKSRNRTLQYYLYPTTPSRNQALYSIHSIHSILQEWEKLPVA